MYTKTNNNYTKKYLNFNKIIGVFIWVAIFIVAPIFLAISFNKSMFYVSVSSNSMAPTIEEGDKIIVSKIDSKDEIQRNDIIIFYSEELGRMLIKRVVGIPGDRILIDENFNLKINGEYIIENSNVNFEDSYTYEGNIQNKEIVVPNEAYFVIGDNNNNSLDSRFWKDKFVLKDLIVGKALVLFSPIKKFSIF